MDQPEVDTTRTYELRMRALSGLRARSLHLLVLLFFSLWSVSATVAYFEDGTLASGRHGESLFVTWVYILSAPIWVSFLVVLPVQAVRKTLFLTLSANGLKAFKTPLIPWTNVDQITMVSTRQLDIRLRERMDLKGNGVLKRTLTIKPSRARIPPQRVYEMLCAFLEFHGKRKKARDG